MRPAIEWRTWKSNWKHWWSDPKNITAVLIVFVGLFVGGLFVDFGQLITGSGFSSRAIQSHDILVTGGRTWVAYTEPKVRLRIINDEQCATCKPDDALLWLRRIVPTLEAEAIDIATDAGQQLIEEFHIVNVPAFVFDPAVRETEFFTQAEPLFREVNSRLLFDINMIGMPIGRYLSVPEIRSDDIVIGANDAPVTLMIFSDFQCTYCREYHAVYKRLLAEYPDRLKLVWKQLPLATHPQAEAAAAAAKCAADQHQFMAYADLLFERQAEWGRTGSERSFKSYAWRIQGMNGATFGQCIDAKTKVAEIAADMQQAAEYHIESAPATFVNREFVLGSVPYPDLKSLVETALTK